MAVGDIGPVIQDRLFANGTFPEICHVDGNVYALVYIKLGNSGHIATFTVDAFGVIGGAFINDFQFTANLGSRATFIQISANVFAVFYLDTGILDTRVQTVGIQNNGIITGNIGTHIFDAGIGWIRDRPIHIAGDIYAIAYQDPASNIRITTVEIQSDGTIIGNVNTWSPGAPTHNLACHIIHISGDIYLAGYSQLVVGTTIITVEIQADGTIVGLINSSAIDTPGAAQQIRIIHVSGTVYAIVYYQSAGGIGRVRTVNVADNGVIGAVIDTDDVVVPPTGWDVIQIGSTVFAVTYTLGNVSHVTTFPITLGGIIGATIDDLLIQAANSRFPNIIIHGDVDIYIMPVVGNINTVHVVTVDIESTALPAVTTDPATGVT